MPLFQIHDLRQHLLLCHLLHFLYTSHWMCILSLLLLPHSLCFRMGLMLSYSCPLVLCILMLGHILLHRLQLLFLFHSHILLLYITLYSCIRLLLLPHLQLLSHLLYLHMYNLLLLLSLVSLLCLWCRFVSRSSTLLLCRMRLHLPSLAYMLLLGHLHSCHLNYIRHLLLSSLHLPFGHSSLLYMLTLLLPILHILCILLCPLSLCLLALLLMCFLLPRIWMHIPLLYMLLLFLLLPWCLLHILLARLLLLLFLRSHHMLMYSLLC